MNAKDYPMKVIIADDLKLMREGLTNVFAKNPKYQIVGEASNGKELFDLVKQNYPDIIIYTAIQDKKGEGVIRIIKQLFSYIKIITLWKEVDVAAILSMIDIGVEGYILKDTGSKELFQAIEAVQGGGKYFAHEISKSLLEHLPRMADYARPTPLNPRLSRRETEVVQLICQEYSSKEIALKLNINSRSVGSYRERIRKKVGAKNMIGIVLFAIKRGIYNVD